MFSAEFRPSVVQSRPEMTGNDEGPEIRESPVTGTFPQVDRCMANLVQTLCQGEGRGFESRLPLSRSSWSGLTFVALRILAGSSRRLATSP
jgi:hypothetical protein